MRQWFHGAPQSGNRITGRGHRKAKSMGRRHLDWRLGLVLILATTIFVAAVCILQRWERRTRPTPQVAPIQSCIR